MQGHQEILSVSLYKGTIVAITHDGYMWQWLKDYKGEWHWRMLELIPHVA